MGCDSKKKNPLLMTVMNPVDTFDKEKDQLWNQAKKIKPDLAKDQFEKVFTSFVNQHHCAPKSVSLEEVPGISPDIQVMAKVGEVKNIWYKPDTYSRKHPYEYFHPTQNEKLASDSNGNVFLYGKTKMRNDGWLHD